MTDEERKGHCAWLRSEDNGTISHRDIADELESLAAENAQLRADLKAAQENYRKGSVAYETRNNELLAERKRLFNDLAAAEEKAFRTALEYAEGIITQTDADRALARYRAQQPRATDTYQADVT